jgi:mRNA interferase MazF
MRSLNVPASRLKAHHPTERCPWAFRPTITVDGEATKVRVEQTTAVAPERLGELVGRVSRAELDEIGEALRLAFELD